ncbi:putative uncharacterized domain protein [Brevibacillus laterosporus GI-9]|uniref:hypothetical protein n=1 Tax=Brevibacillus laterosporus TaxID=1465 RepID=UPI00024053F7|nr:hypothetical protein [Brevibacillus laterosporus]CCF16461.1 putative uncharacterized domain protein [Brevibacillus laterosporus GI-9]
MYSFYSNNNGEYRQLENERATPPLPYGPYTCKQGFVWREAYNGDFVCVRPEARQETALENALGPSRRQPGGGAYGPDTCKQGFVWREARPSDHVCVPPHRREQARVDNGIAPFTMAYPPAAPSNGIMVWDELIGTPASSERRILVSGTFTPNKEVEFFVYGDRYGWSDRMKSIGNFRADANGKVGPIIAISYCSFYSDPTRMPVIVVDKGTGIVSNAGTVANPFCIYN